MSTFSRFQIPVSSLLLATLLLHAGCASGPDHKAPVLPVKVDSFGSAVPAGEASSKAWWLRCEDPGLAKVVERALSGSRDIRMASARLSEARALRREARTAFFPMGSVSSGYRRQLDSTVFFKGMPRGLRENDVFDVGVDVAWELDLFGRIRRSVEAGDALHEASGADLAQLRLSVAAEAARAYVELLATRQALSLQHSLVELGSEGLRLARCQVEVGKIGRERLAPAEAELASAQDTLRSLEFASLAVRNRLGVLMGERDIEVTTAAALPHIPTPAFSGSAEKVLLGRPDVRAAERRLAAGTAGIGIARADYFPTLGFVARVGAEATKLDSLTLADANTFAFGPRLSWDLLSLHRTRARVKGAEARAEECLNAWENTVLLALEEIDNALARHRLAGEQREEWRRAAQAGDAAARIGRLKRDQGQLDPLESLQLERASLQARLALLRAETELANAGILLQHSFAEQ